MTTQAEPTHPEEKTSGWRGSREVWLQAAQAALIASGVDAVKIQPLANGLQLSRTSFYWFFRDRKALLDALLEEWDRVGLLDSTSTDCVYDPIAAAPLTQQPGTACRRRRKFPWSRLATP